MESLPNNSEKALAEKKLDRKVEKIEGGAARHRPTFWKMLKSNFIPENLTFMDVVSDMVMPAIRDGIFDIISGSIDCWRGSVGSNSYYRNARRPGSVNGVRTQANPVNYNKVSRIGQQYEKPQIQQQVSSYDDIFLPDIKTEDGRFISGVDRAKEVIAMLDDDLARYQVARVYDLFEHCGLPSSPNGSDYNYGWINLDAAGYKAVRGGAVLIMPKAMPIQD